MVACNLERAKVLRENQVGLERRRLEIRCVGKEDAMGNQDSAERCSGQKYATNAQIAGVIRRIGAGQKTQHC